MTYVLRVESLEILRDRRLINEYDIHIHYLMAYHAIPRRNIVECRIEVEFHWLDLWELQPSLGEGLLNRNFDLSKVVHRSAETIFRHNFFRDGTGDHASAFSLDLDVVDITL